MESAPYRNYIRLIIDEILKCAVWKEIILRTIANNHENILWSHEIANITTSPLPKPHPNLIEPLSILACGLTVLTYPNVYTLGPIHTGMAAARRALSVWNNFTLKELAAPLPFPCDSALRYVRLAKKATWYDWNGGRYP